MVGLGDVGGVSGMRCRKRSSSSSRHIVFSNAEEVGRESLTAGSKSLKDSKRKD